MADATKQPSRILARMDAEIAKVKARLTESTQNRASHDISTTDSKAAVDGAPTAAHTRQLTLRSAMAIVERMDRSADSGISNNFEVSNAAAASGKDPMTSAKSVGIVMKSLIAKVVELTTQNAELQKQLSHVSTGLNSATDQITNLLAQLKAANEASTELEAENKRLRAASSLSRGSSPRTGFYASPFTRLKSQSRLQSPSFEVSSPITEEKTVEDQNVGLKSEEIPLITSPPVSQGQQGTAMWNSTPPRSGVDDADTAPMECTSPIPLVKHVVDMADELQAAVEQLKHERIRRRAVTAAYSTLLESHVKILSSNADQAAAVLANMPDAVVNESAELPEDSWLSPQKKRIGTFPVGSPSAIELPFLTEPAESADNDHEPDLEEQIVALTNAAEIDAHIPPARARRSSLPSATPSFFLSKAAAKLAPELLQLLASLREFDSLTSDLSFKHDAKSASAVEETEVNAMVDVFGYEAAILQRLIDVSQSTMRIATALDSRVAAKDVTSTDYSRALARFQHLRNTISLPGEKDPSSQEDATSALPLQMVGAVSRLIGLLSAWKQRNTSTSAHASTADPLTNAKLRLDAVISTVMAFWKRLLLRFSADVVLALNIALRMLGSAAVATAAEFRSSVGSDSFSFVAASSAGEQQLRAHIVAAAQLAQLESFAEQLTASAGVPPWQPDSVPHCSHCAVDFTLMNRRHHCRSCGQVVCNTCTGKPFPLAHFGISPAQDPTAPAADKFLALRVCHACRSVLELVMEPLGAGAGEK